MREVLHKISADSYDLLLRVQPPPPPPINVNDTSATVERAFASAIYSLDKRKKPAVRTNFKTGLEKLSPSLHACERALNREEIFGESFSHSLRRASQTRCVVSVLYNLL